MTDDAGRATVVLFRGDVEVASWPLVRRERVDLTTVDELARLQLVARRLGFTVRLRHPDVGLLEMLDLAGLAAVVAVDLCGPSSVEVGGKPERLEEGDVEEVVVPDDPVA